MVFALRPLPYSPGALAPYLSARAMRLHHEGHLGTYVNTLNELLTREPRFVTMFGAMTLDQIIRSASGTVFNNAAQIWNHSFFFNQLAKDVIPKEPLRNMVAQRFGSFETALARLTDAAVSLFGSGWVWLTRGPKGKLDILTTKDADLPMRHGVEAVLAIDVWEHAYYVDYENRKKIYIEALLGHLIDWDFVAEGMRAS